MERLRIRKYAYSDFQSFEAKLSSGGMAMIKGIELRYSASGQELERLELKYVLRRHGSDWRIAAGTMHETDLKVRDFRTANMQRSTSKVW